MFTHYLKLAFRNMQKHKTQSLTGIFGLAFGLACFVPAHYWMRYETSYDSFYPGAENIYRIYAVEKQSGKVNEWAPGILKTKLLEQFPAIVASAGFLDMQDNYSTEGMPYIQLKTLLADSAFFRVFQYRVISGDAPQPLKVLHDIVITESVAVRLFGDAEKAIGQQVKSILFNSLSPSDFPPFTVTAVIKDPPLNTNLTFDAILFSKIQTYFIDDPEEKQWKSFDNAIYVKVHPRADANVLAAQLRDITSRLGNNDDIKLQMLQLSDIRHQMNSNLPFTLNFIRLFIAAGILLLFSAFFNFLTFHLDLFRQRIPELRQRKVHGATGRRLIGQMTVEMACSILLSLLIACCLVILVRPAFSGLLDIEIKMSQLLYLFLVCGLLLTSLILFAGLIPFWRLSYLVTRYLAKGKPPGQPQMRHMAVSLQLTASIVFIIAALVVMMQMRFVNRKDLGFDSSGIIQVSGMSITTTTSKGAVMRRELAAIPQIENVTASYFEPQHNKTNAFTKTEIEWPGKLAYEKPVFQIILADSQFGGTFRLNMLRGEWWSEGEQQKIVLNEEAVRVMGLDEPIGAIIRMRKGITGTGPIQEYVVAGVVNDFHTLSLRSHIQPAIFIESREFDKMYIRFVPGQEQEAIRRMMDVLPGIDASLADVRLMTLDEVYARLNHSEQVSLKMFSVMATVCLLISLSAIHAVASATTHRRRKEIAIRKVMGAQIGDIVRMFFHEYTLQVILAGIVALPLAYLAMSRWLQGYAYHTNIPWWLLTGVVVTIAAVVLLTVLGQVLKAAGSNPADVLKSE